MRIERIREKIGQGLRVDRRQGGLGLRNGGGRIRRNKAVGVVEESCLSYRKTLPVPHESGPDGVHAHYGPRQTGVAWPRRASKAGVTRTKDPAVGRRGLRRLT